MMDSLVGMTSSEQSGIAMRITDTVGVMVMGWFLTFLTIRITARSAENIEAEVVIVVTDQGGAIVGQGVRETGMGKDIAIAGLTGTGEETGVEIERRGLTIIVGGEAVESLLYMIQSDGEFCQSQLLKV